MFKLIATQPLMGRARDELATGLRSFAFGRYVIFFESSQLTGIVNPDESRRGQIADSRS
jgi:plasmid stabilization system protein ParE